MNGLIDFQCEVYESGYEILTIEEFELHGTEATSEPEFEYARFQKKPNPKNSKKIDYVKPIDIKSSKHIFNLTDYPGAYYELVSAVSDWLQASIRGNDPINKLNNMLNDSIIKFANKYGLLTNSPYGERVLDIWLDNMWPLSNSVGFLEQIKAGDLERLKEKLIIEDGKFKICDAYGFMEDGEIIKYYSEIPTIGQTPPRNYSEAAYHSICDVVNKKLKDSLVTEIIVNQTNTRTDMAVRPKDLLSALWLQLGHAVSRNLEFKQTWNSNNVLPVQLFLKLNQRNVVSKKSIVLIDAANVFMQENAERRRKQNERSY